ncbi:Nop domain-containing protein [Aulographum hederae CBS 113979]|uniref:Nop domain-containing protein n=1 Tax=Aulographum hederae CBS 113979 TaxID=1176131 RepID=A0A6G1H8J7_9PEZI|nr:Nop domain-containing protein [Aulographum hederae CBS 113979]
MNLGEITDVREVATLMNSISPVLKEIESYDQISEQERQKDLQNYENHPEYKLLNKGNAIVYKIGSEIRLVHKFIRDHYASRFPELETLVQNPMQYAQAVAIIGNGPMEDLSPLRSALNGRSLKQILDGPTLMVVNVEAATTKGQPLGDKELEEVNRACEMALELACAQDIMTSFIESRMTRFAPNLSILVGSLTAARLISSSGGLAGLAKTPACNVINHGRSTKITDGLSTNVNQRHLGYLSQSPVIMGVPLDVNLPAQRTVAGKAVLAARVDSGRSFVDGSYGQKMLDHCERHIEILMNPNPNKGNRALPVPDEKPSKRRGGKRIRKAKEANMMTDIRKSQNKMAFGQEEKEVGYGTGEGTSGLGMYGASDGRIRAQQVDKRTAAKLSKKNMGWNGPSGGAGNATVTTDDPFGNGLPTGHGLKGQATAGVGAASSLNFSASQSLKLVNPKAAEEAERLRKTDESQWFKRGAFTQVTSSMAPPPLAKKRKIEGGK